MAPGRSSRLVALLIFAVGLAPACATVADRGAIDETSTTATSRSTSTTVPADDSTTTSTASTTTVPPTTTTAPDITASSRATTTTTGLEASGAAVRLPEGEGSFPVVVLVHGGGWVGGDPSSMTDLAVYLTDNGLITVNTPYRLAVEEASFPAAVDDVACAVRMAAALPGSNGSVTVLGHSAGAHLSALVALTGERYGLDCPYPDAGGPEALIGLAGPYDVDRLGLLMLPFFGGGPNVESEAWEAGNPMKLITGDADFSSLIMFGDRDALVDPSFALDFHQALVDVGADSTLELVEGARHMDLRDPAAIGELILAWLDRER